MKVLHITTYTEGGAGKACQGIVDLQKQYGIEADIFSIPLIDKRNRINHKQFILSLSHLNQFSRYLHILKFYLFRLLKKILIKTNILSNKIIFSFPNEGHPVDWEGITKSYDLVQIHWFHGLLRLKDISKIKPPKIFFLHDAYFHHGIYHYNLEKLNKAYGYQMNFVKKSIYKFFDQKFLNYKNSLISQESNLYFLSPSNWILEGLKINTSLISLKHQINYYIDLSGDKIESTNKEDYVLFIAQKIDDPLKGFQFIKEASIYLNENEIKLYSTGNISEESKHYFDTNFGFITDRQKKGVIIKNAKAVLIPSIIDNMPQTMLEALIVGVPVISFKGNGGPNEIIRTGINGLLINRYSGVELSKSIKEISNQNFDNEQIKRNTKELLNPKLIFSKYLKFYETILKEQN